MSPAKRNVSSLQDLADIAGVSRATVSRALNDSPLINVKTRKKLQALAAEHNYTVNKQARDFRLRQTRVISVVFMLDPKSDQHPSDPFFLEMLGGIADGLAEHDYDLLLARAPVRSIRELADTRVVKHVDGVIFVGQGEEHETLNELAEAGTSIVVWGGPVADKKYALVGGDNFAGGYSVTTHLLGLGRKRVAFFGNRRTPENQARYDGYQRALVEADIAADSKLVIDIPSDMEHAQAVIAHELGKDLDLDAIVCTSDVMALAAISALAERGIRVPDDIAVTGYDDIRLASYSSPPLTTVRQGIPQAGRALVNTVLALISNQEIGDTVLKSELIVRRSCGNRPSN